MPRRTSILALLVLLLACGGGAAATGPTEAPPPAATAAPSPTLAPPTPTLSREGRLEQVAREAARPLDTRAAVGLPAGAWKVSTLLPGEIQITYPMTAGGDNARTVRQGQRQIAAIVMALFQADAALARVNVIGTLPLGDAESPAISVALTRDEFSSWSGQADALPGMQVSQRLQ